MQSDLWTETPLRRRRSTVGSPQPCPSSIGSPVRRVRVGAQARVRAFLGGEDEESTRRRHRLLLMRGKRRRRREDTSPSHAAGRARLARRTAGVLETSSESARILAVRFRLSCVGRIVRLWRMHTTGCMVFLRMYEDSCSPSPRLSCVNVLNSCRRALAFSLSSDRPCQCLCMYYIVYMAPD